MAGWHVGQKVVCIRDLSRCGLQMELVPRVGALYTIRDIEWGIRPLDRVFFRLAEIVNEPLNYASGRFECSFGCDNFRALEEPSVRASRVQAERMQAERVQAERVDA